MFSDKSTTDWFSLITLKWTDCMFACNSSPSGQNVRHFPDDIFKCIFMNENFCILILLSLKCVSKDRISNIPAYSGDKPLSETMLTQFTYMRHQRWMSSGNLSHAHIFSIHSFWSILMWSLHHFIKKKVTYGIFLCPKTMRALWAKGQNRELYSLSKPAVFAGKSEPANDMIFVLAPLWHPERFPFTENQAGLSGLVGRLGEYKEVFIERVRIYHLIFPINLYSCISIFPYDKNMYNWK